MAADAEWTVRLQQPSWALDTLACPDSGDCLAGGPSAAAEVAGDPESGPGGLEVTVDAGRTWTSLPQPDAVTALACPRPASCLAVESGPAATGWSVRRLVRAGGQWAVATTTAAGAGAPTGVTALSCPDALRCVGVGGLQETGSQGAVSTVGVAYVSVDGGDSWAPVALPDGAASVDDPLVPAAVSCGSPTVCVAVGSHAPNGQGALVLTSHDGGQQWALAGGPTPVAGLGLRAAQLQGISCTSPRRCTAVGVGSRSGPSPSQPPRLVAFWATTDDGGVRWTAHAVGAAGGSDLVGVACPAGSSRCAAVGTVDAPATRSNAAPASTRGGVVDTLGPGPHWSVGSFGGGRPTPGGVSGAPLGTGVACPTTRRCYAELPAASLSTPTTLSSTPWDVVATGDL